jgi:hypothetical protein
MKYTSNCTPSVLIKIFVLERNDVIINGIEETI